VRRALARSQNVILNQFSEFSNYLIHYLCTGRALDRVLQRIAPYRPGLRLTAFVSATGSAGTIGAGDYLKSRHGTRSPRWKRSNARRCSRTATASTTSRASATSTFR
jgi:cysteine synthase